MEGGDRAGRISGARAGDGAGMPLPAAILLWKDLKERVDLHPLEDPVDRVGVLSGERLRVCERLGLKPAARAPRTARPFTATFGPAGDER